VPALSRASFYPSVVVSHAKFNPVLEIADAVAGLALDFAEYNLRTADEDELPDVGWQDEQMIRAAAKFRAGPTGEIHRLRLHGIPRSHAGCRPDLPLGSAIVHER
jgi:hypothetical protein